VESIEHPERFPLISQAQPHKRLQPAPARPRGKKAQRSRRG
jgi:hypothetical protein